MKAAHEPDQSSAGGAMPPADRVLLSEFVREGSQDAFAEIVRRHSGMVYGACLRILKDAHAAEDAAQAVFLVLVKKARELPPDIVLAGWLFRAAELSARDTLKMRRRRIKHERQAAAQDGSDGEGAANPWDEIKVHLDAALAALPRPQRDVIVLRYLNGYSQQETARELNCPLETVHTRATRALARLREMLRRRGCAISSVTLVATLSLQIQPAPAALMSAIRSGCLKHAVSPAAPTPAPVPPGAFRGLKATLVLAACATALLLALGLVLWMQPARDSFRAAPVSAPLAPAAVPAAVPVPGTFGPESDGLALSLMPLPEHPRAPLAFRATLQNVSRHRIKVWDHNACAGWGTRLVDTSTHQRYDGGLVPLGAFPWAMLELAPDETFSVILAAYGGATNSGREALALSELPAGRYQIEAVYDGGPVFEPDLTPRERKALSAADGLWHGRAFAPLLPFVLPAAPARNAASLLPRFSTAVRGLQARLAWLPEHPSAPLAFELTLRNSGAQPLKLYQGTGLAWTFSLRECAGTRSEEISLRPEEPPGGSLLEELPPGAERRLVVTGRRGAVPRLKVRGKCFALAQHQRGPIIQERKDASGAIQRAELGCWQGTLGSEAVVIDLDIPPSAPRSGTPRSGQPADF